MDAESLPTAGSPPASDGDESDANISPAEAITRICPSSQW